MEPFELEQSTGLEPSVDRRRRMDEPLPVKLIAVDDVRLPAPPNLEKELDAFYVALWQFEKEAGAADLVYRAENFRLRLQIVADPDPIQRESLRPQGIEVQSLTDAEHKLVEAELEYIRQRGLTPGRESLLMRDPAGNWIELFESRQLM